MTKTNINNQSKIILQDQVASIFNGTSLNWLLISSDSEAIKTLKDFEQIQIPQSTDIVILNLINNLSKVVIKQLTDKCIDLNIETLGIIDEDFLRSYEIDSNISDYIMQPIKVSELTFRISRLMQSLNPDSKKNVISIGDLTINTANYEVIVSGEKVNLRFKEYELLLLLASNPGRGFDRATLLNQIWGYDYFGGTRTVDVHVRRLRSKIEKDPDNLFIETIWNVGYKFRGNSK
tara:strand:+ start:3095 stop:3796 length:702 start_codon:yes stop_codon:yes gene_type:complete